VAIPNNFWVFDTLFWSSAVYAKYFRKTFDGIPSRFELLSMNGGSESVL
jgi:hypothetical protein